MPSPKSKLKKSSHSFSQSESNVYTPKIPSRDAIIKHLEEVGKPIAHTKLCKQMGLKKEQQMEGLRNRLIKMKQDGQVISNRLGAYGLAAHMDLIKGRIKGNKDGAGYFIPDDGSDDLFFGLREMEKLFDGDQVLARFTGFDNRGRREGTAVEILQRRHRIQPGQADDFRVRNVAQMLDARAQSERIMSILLASVAGISLLVGGIGIMNIMLVSVTERTREIGLRMAVGARRRDILLQFVTEAMAVSLIGGAIGVVIGLAGSMTAARIGDWPIITSPIAALLAIGFAALIGIFFGYYPAYKASRLDPITALRHE